MKARNRRRKRKAVSTIIAAIFILATLLAFLLAFTFIMQQMATTTSNVIRANQLLLQKQQERLTINSITITGTSVTITATNDGTQPIILVAYIIRNNTVKIVGKITPEKYVAPQTKTTITITTPQPLSPASTYVITLISKLGNAFKATYPIPTTNATTLPGIQATLANTYLPRTAGPGTVTWAGTAIIPTPQTRAGNVYTYTALTGAVNPTNQPTNLNYADNQNITATPTQSYIAQLIKRTAIFYDDFQNNPFTDGNLTIVNGTWIWNPTGRYIEQIDSSTGEYIVRFNLRRTVNLASSDLFILLKANISNVSYLIASVPIAPPPGPGGPGNAYVNYYWGTAGAMYINDTWYYELGALGHNTTIVSTGPTPGLPPGFIPVNNVYGASISDPNTINYVILSSQPSLNTWFIVLTKRIATSNLNSSIYDISGNYLGSIETSDSYFKPTALGIGTWYASASFDDVVITANASPIYVNISAPSFFSGYNVSIYNASGDLVNSSIIDTSGHSTISIISQPIIRGGTIVIYDTSGNEVVSMPFSLIVGGDVYAVLPKYVSSLEVRTQVDLTSTVNVAGNRVVSADIGLALQSSLSTTDFSVYAYDWALGAFIKVFNSTFVAHLNITGLRNSFVNSINGTVVLRLVAYDDSAFTLHIDCLNAFPSVWVPVSQEVILVGNGGTDYIDVFKLSSIVPGSIALSYLETISVPGTVFNGSVDITYDGYTTYSLLMVNGSGVYNLSLLNPSAPPSRITTACRASGSGGVRAEVVHDPATGKTYLVVLPGVGNQSFCVYNLTAYPSGGAWLIGFASRGLNVSSPYTVSAVVGTSVYTVLQNITSKAAVLVAVNPFTNSTFVPPSNTANFMPGLSNVGLAYDGKYLWLMLEGGSLYKVDPTYANFTNVPVLLLPAPVGYGDRMEYYNGALILVRDSGSSEVWVIPTS